MEIPDVTDRIGSDPPDLDHPNLDHSNLDQPSCSKMVPEPVPIQNCAQNVPICPPSERKRRTAVYRRTESKQQRKLRKERIVAAVEMRKQKLRSLKEAKNGADEELTNLSCGPTLLTAGDRHGPFAGRPRYII